MHQIPRLLIKICSGASCAVSESRFDGRQSAEINTYRSIRRAAGGFARPIRYKSTDKICKLDFIA